MYHKAHPGELIQWVTPESRSSAASNSGLIRIGTQPRTADAWHHDSCRQRGVVTRDFSAILTVCLTVFPFEFRPPTFTIGFYRKKSFISELMILECSFPLRGAWRDHRFPEPFSWFLHETGLESLKITSARCFLLKCQRKVSKKAKQHRQFRGVLGRWRTAAINRTTFHGCQRCRKTAVFAVFSWLWGVIWRGIAFRDQQCQFLTRNTSSSIENESNCSMTSECMRTDSIFPRGAGLEHGRNKKSISRFSRFQFSAFWSNGLASSVFTFAPILLRFFLLSSSMQGLKHFVTDFLISTCEKVMLHQSRPGRVKQRFWRFFVHISTSKAKLKIL